MSDDACATPRCGHAQTAHEFSRYDCGERVSWYSYDDGLQFSGCPCTAYLPPRPVPEEEAKLTDEEREELRRALVRSPNAAWITQFPGPTDISGSFVPELAYVVELIIAKRLRGRGDHG